MKTNIHYLLHPAQFFLEWKIFQIMAVEKKKRILCYKFFSPRKSYTLSENVEKYSRAGHITGDNMAHTHCMLDT